LGGGKFGDILNCLLSINECDRQTDRQTSDGQTLDRASASTALAHVALRGKIGWFFTELFKN